MIPELAGSGIRMASIDLPRDLQDYFAFAETEPTRNGRRFSITLPYLRADGRLDRLQWWYHLPPAREQVMGESAVDTLRDQAVVRFRKHIDRWLQNTGQILHGRGAIPQLDPQGVPLPMCDLDPQPLTTSHVMAGTYPVERAEAAAAPAAVTSKTAYG